MDGIPTITQIRGHYLKQTNHRAPLDDWGRWSKGGWRRWVCIEARFNIFIISTTVESQKVLATARTTIVLQ